jgi:hypothetical protein
MPADRHEPEIDEAHALGMCMRSRPELSAVYKKSTWLGVTHGLGEYAGHMGTLPHPLITMVEW